MSAFSDFLTDLAARSAYSLAYTADCASPDSLESAGARFLTSVRDATRELLSDLDADGIDALMLDRLDDDGSLAQIADDAPDVYTHTLWSEFVDLAAYQEDPTELGVDGSDMEQAARVCLYIIADRLVRALVEEAQEAAMTDAAVDADFIEE